MIRALGPVALLVALAALLIFTNLDGRLLWDDEAETALLAQRVLRFGVPIAWDGRDLISQECSTDYDVNYLWRQTPWLPIYATALSFKVFGVETLWARLPFAVLGVLAVLSCYVLARALFVGRAPALLATALLALSVPFLLYVRQDSAGVATVLISVPSITVFDLQGKGGSVLAAASVKQFVATLVWYARQLDLYALPVVFLAVLAAGGLLVGGVRWVRSWPSPA